MSADIKTVLTEEQIESIWYSHKRFGSLIDRIAFARAIEAAVLAAQPQAGGDGAKDAERLQYVLAHGRPMMRDFIYRYQGIGPIDWYETPEAAIDAAIAAGKHKGE